ncbi:tyrosyl-DNA phosphodiesterase [Aureococcus anophagefferens]|nr:tyrosyl-DNA phosphodiesterase [Aureococcus anophagefferens]
MWVCGTCTLLNESDSFLQCSACAALRPAKRKALDDDQGVSKRQAIDLCDSDDDGGDAAVVFELDDDEGGGDAALGRELAAQDEQAAAAAELVTQQDEAFARSLHAAQEQERHALKVALGVDRSGAAAGSAAAVFVGDGFIMNELDEKIRTQEGARDAPRRRP